MLKILRDLLRYNREFLAGSILLGIILVMVALSFVSPYPENAIYAVAPDMPPSWQNWFGTTSRGEDVFWAMTGALRNTLMFGVLVAVLSRLIALVVGLLSGYLGGKTDQAIMAINDTIGALPHIPILLLVYFVLRNQMSWEILAVVASL